MLAVAGEAVIKILGRAGGRRWPSRRTSLHSSVTKCGALLCSVVANLIPPTQAGEKGEGKHTFLIEGGTVPFQCVRASQEMTALQMFTDQLQTN